MTESCIHASNPAAGGLKGGATALHNLRRRAFQTTLCVWLGTAAAPGHATELAVERWVIAGGGGESAGGGFGLAATWGEWEATGVPAAEGLSIEGGFWPEAAPSVQTSRPVLAIQAVAGGVIVSWDAATGTGYQLESAPLLDPVGAWSPVATRVDAIDGGRRSVVLSWTPGRRFLRLRKP